MAKKVENIVVPAVPYYRIEEPYPDYLLPPSFNRPPLHRKLVLIACILILCAAFSVAILWPSNPNVFVSRLHLDHLHISPKKPISLDITINLTLKVHNKNLVSLDYDSLQADVWYRGMELASLTSNGGHIRARRSSYIDANLQVDGVKVMEDAVYLLDDLAKGTIPFDTVTHVHGYVGFLLFDIPIRGSVSCGTIVNIQNQTIVSQHCTPQ